ncbi:histone-like nucleoid-structuring protein Lsr2 [Streptomyces sp. H27-D2]|uniref:histone-like nucleoid-structuring protein Lsr2 n=1 Tax=Streptomyces sp. H27-D2 TaxID=3046304 RepID=UPI002DBA1084|nr:Lsr2 family protein [Streptomyces sp. H27-D2]MEC4018662.1 Lsr2 family protein [Streptomyces sp. H27-D2]
MAQKVVTTYVDDLTGEESTEISTSTILVNGAGVEIDLTHENYDKLLELLNPYLTAAGARRVRGGVAAKGKARKAPTTGENTADIRAWAKANGHDVNDRGRVPASVKEAYEKANK